MFLLSVFFCATIFIQKKFIVNVTFLAFRLLDMVKSAFRMIRKLK